MNQLIRLSGVTYEGRQDTIAMLSVYDRIYMERDYFNKHDYNAIGVYTNNGTSIGWIPKETASFIAPQIDNGNKFEIKINRILGGKDLAYGVEILLSQMTDLSDYKQKITDMISDQTLTSSETAINLLNESIKQQQERYILEGDIEELMILINNGWISLDDIKAFSNYCFEIGKFEDSYNSLHTLNELSDYYGHYEIQRFCQDNLRIFNSYGYENPLPKPSAKHYDQSQEKADESYPDLERVYEAINTNMINPLLESLYEDIKTENNERRAAALFALGELHYLNQNMQESIELYIQAIRENPNKALYWGYTAQVMNRNKMHPLISIRFLHNAIKLDSLNPRWHFLKSLILLDISNREEINELFNQAVYEAHYGLKLCRPDQIGLRKAILLLLGQE